MYAAVCKPGGGSEVQASKVHPFPCRQHSGRQTLPGTDHLRYPPRDLVQPVSNAHCVPVDSLLETVATGPSCALRTPFR